MNDIMLDLETMGTAANAPIVGIGAVRFNPKSEEIGDTFYTLIDLESSVNAGGVMSASTVLWWMQQSDAARNEICNPDIVRFTIHEALLKFSDWVKLDDKIWGNGVDFDNVILSATYKQCGIKQPWQFWNNRCYRTVKSLRPNIKLEREGVHHNCLDDAISQAKHLQKLLGGRK